MATTPTLDPARFAQEVRRMLDLAGRNAAEVAERVVMQMGERLVMKSPVGDPTEWKNPAPKGYVGGRFRGNWQHGFNIRPSGTLTQVDPGGSATIERINQRVRNTQGAGGIHYLVNNLPYAYALEYGHSKQAPIGMVGITALEFYDHVARAAAHVASRAKATP